MRHFENIVVGSFYAYRVRVGGKLKSSSGGVPHEKYAAFARVFSNGFRYAHKTFFVVVVKDSVKLKGRLRNFIFGHFALGGTIVL